MSYVYVRHNTLQHGKILRHTLDKGLSGQYYYYYCYYHYY